MTTYNWSEIPVEQMNPAVSRQVIHAANLTIARIAIAKGAAVPTHAHINEQVLNLISGRLQVIVDGVETVLDGGQTLVIPPNVPHSVMAYEDVVAVDIFSPRREDWLRGDDAYLRQG